MVDDGEVGVDLPDNVGSLLSLVQVEEPPDLGSSVLSVTARRHMCRGVSPKMTDRLGPNRLGMTLSVNPGISPSPCLLIFKARTPISLLYHQHPPCVPISNNPKLTRRCTLGQTSSSSLRLVVLGNKTVPCLGVVGLAGG